MKSVQTLKTLTATLLTLVGLSACGGHAVPTAAMPAQLRTQAVAAPQVPTAAPLTVDQSSLSEDTDGHQFGFDHLNLLFHDASGTRQDSIALAYRHDLAVHFIWTAQGADSANAVNNRISASDKAAIQKLVAQLQSLRARTPEQKFHLELAVLMLQRNLAGMPTV